MGKGTLVDLSGASLTITGFASQSEQETQTTLLGTIASGISQVADTPTATEPGVVLLGVRTNTLSTLGIPDGDLTLARFNQYGALYIWQANALQSDIDSVALGLPNGATRVQKQLRLTASTTSTDLWTPASSKKIAVTALTISWNGANACRLTIWEGSNADVTLSDTEPFLFDKSLDASADGGAHLTWPLQTPWITTTADYELHVTLSAAKTVWIGVVGYEF